MSTDTKTPPIPMSAAMAADIARWSEAERVKREKLEERGKAVGTFDEVKQKLKDAFAQLPRVDVPFHLTPAGDRMARFKVILSDSPAFMQKVDRTKLPNPAAFDAVAKWDGEFPGPCAFGPTGMAKTFAAWSALGRLYVQEPIYVDGAEVARSFAWFPVRRLATELAKYEENECAADFFRMVDLHRMLFVDDVDKLNWDYNSEKVALFSFYDWVYRHHKPCITTTNKDRKWWTDKMGDAFARRMFDDAHFSVRF